VVANSQPNPIDGTANADTIREDGNNGTHVIYQSQAALQNRNYMMSFFARPINRDWVAAGSSYTNDLFQHWDITNGTVGTGGAGVIEAGMEAIGNQWYRCWFTFQHTADRLPLATTAYEIYLAEADNDRSFQGLNQASIYLFGAQLSEGEGLKSYRATTTAAIEPPFIFSRNSAVTYRDADGVLQSAGIDVVPIKFNDDGTHGGLFEMAATNICLQSQTMDNATWTKTRATITANAAAAPDGTNTGERFLDDATAASTHFISQSIVLAAKNYTMSVWINPSSNDWFALSVGLIAAPIQYFDVTNMTVGTGTNVNYAGIEQYANGWVRCYMNYTAAAGDVGANDHIIYGAEADQDITFDGDSTTMGFLWGAQVETDDMTSYIVTVAASATRNGSSAEFHGNMLKENSCHLYMDVDILFDPTTGGRRYLIYANPDSAEAIFLSKFTANQFYLAHQDEAGNARIHVYDITTLGVTLTYGGNVKLRWNFSRGSFGTSIQFNNDGVWRKRTGLVAGGNSRNWDNPPPNIQLQDTGANAGQFILKALELDYE
jgi:hypothetical protein